MAKSVLHEKNMNSLPNMTPEVELPGSIVEMKVDNLDSLPCYTSTKKEKNVRYI
ncbi:unnamed protein product [Thelazia callipaeda]|uniref:Transposase n=1 Tax=Thelazia callipaeda TaxID=103827 RepID=A0A0N5CTR3_THECL|nr:unnamed protein product [Thelazia callipaeda]